MAVILWHEQIIYISQCQIKSNSDLDALAMSQTRASTSLERPERLKNLQGAAIAHRVTRARTAASFKRTSAGAGCRICRALGACARAQARLLSDCIVWQAAVATAIAGARARSPLEPCPAALTRPRRRQSRARPGPHQPP